jgi:hypothetical protein
MDIPTPHVALGASPTERLATYAAELAVVAALPEYWGSPLADEALTRGRELQAKCTTTVFDLDVFVESLKAPHRTDWRWMHELCVTFNAVSTTRLAVWLADTCITSALVEDRALVEGPTLRRLNTVLDIAGVDFSALEPQAAFVSMSESIAEAKLTWVHTAGSVGIGGAAGFASGFFFMPVISSWGGKAVDFFLNEASRTDEISEQTARLLVSALAASDGEIDEGRRVCDRIWMTLYEANLEAARRLTRSRAKSANIYLGVGAAADQRVREISSAVQFLGELMDSTWDAAPSVDVPDLGGLTLPAAEAVLTSAGFVTKRQATGDAWIVNAANWYVASQVVEGDQTPPVVALHVAKIA